MSASARSQVPSVPLKDGRSIPQLGLGVWQVPVDRCAEVVGHALEIGLRHVDTAAAYGNEAQVGEAIRESGIPRDDLFVTTKLWNDDQGHEAARRALHTSLERLGLDVVDLYLIHWPMPSAGRYVDTWKTFVELQQEGLVRSVGVSNFLPEHLDRIVAETGVEPVVNQVELHPRFAQRELRDVHAERGIVTEAWSPLGQGQVLEDATIAAIAERLGRTPAQVVLRWHLRQGNVVFPKSVTPARIEENLDLFGFELSAEDVAAIDALDRGPDGRIGPDPATFTSPS
jgi:2,5-diketo-D-gluconate reductase A